MKSVIWSNKVAWLKIVYPQIIAWATELDYSIPSISKLAEYTIKMLDCESYPSTYRGETIMALGTHYGHIKSIKIAFNRSKVDVISTLIHEFAHAVQLFSMGKEFDLQYQAETLRADHSENKFEDEARALQDRLRKWMIRDSLLRSDLLGFEFEYEIEAAPPKPKKLAMESYYYPIWRESN